MKAGDEVRIKNKPEFGIGKVIRFYANHGTVLVDFINGKSLTYCDYSSLIKRDDALDQK